MSEGPAKKQVRLTPPPRVSDVRDQGQPAGSGRQSGGSHRYLHWVTVAAFVLLGIAAVVVFGFLPRWVEEERFRTSSEPVETSTDSTVTPPPSPEVQNLPAPEPLQTVPAPEPVDQEVVSTPSARPVPMPAPTPPAVAKRTDTEFRQNMSAGLAALERQDFVTARDHLRRAVQLEPDSPESADALIAAEEGLRLQAIATHQAKAAELEAAERWQGALDEYKAVLALDPTIKFAQAGAERSRTRAELSARLDFHLQNPERLSTDEVLRDAEALLEEASQVQPASARLSRQIEGLRQSVAIASTPIRVALISDNLTEVTVYKVGRLGAFERRVLELRPGTYTVVGRRDGYRDVRRQLEVVPGREIEPLTIRCEEKI
jgi:tetratricopeptide (TPR) repeat protein